MFRAPAPRLLCPLRPVVSPFTDLKPGLCLRGLHSLMLGHSGGHCYHPACEPPCPSLDPSPRNLTLLLSQNELSPAALLRPSERRMPRAGGQRAVVGVPGLSPHLALLSRLTLLTRF